MYLLSPSETVPCKVNEKAKAYILLIALKLDRFLKHLLLWSLKQTGNFIQLTNQHNNSSLTYLQNWVPSQYQYQVPKAAYIGICLGEKNSQVQSLLEHDNFSQFQSTSEITRIKDVFKWTNASNFISVFLGVQTRFLQYLYAMICPYYFIKETMLPHVLISLTYEEPWKRSLFEILNKNGLEIERYIFFLKTLTIVWA